ncbi:MAG: hypothetical protein IKM45_04035 [Opitutales bacterium]|nr:hypothetical protein [Opitutales bacterium]
MNETIKKIFSVSAFYWIPACAIAYLWIFLSGEISDMLSPWNLSIFAPGLLVVVPALLMPFPRGLVVVLISGFLFDVSLPVPFEKMESALFDAGREMFLFGEMTTDVPATVGFGATWMVIFFFALRFLRAYIDLSSPKQWLVTALILNFVIFLLWACAISWTELGKLAFWGGFFATAIISSAFIVLLGWWFFDAVVSLYRMCGVDLVGEREVEEK